MEQQIVLFGHDVRLFGLYVSIVAIVIAIAGFCISWRSASEATRQSAENAWRNYLKLALDHPNLSGYEKISFSELSEEN
jgi:hypothetical protein